MSEEKRTKYTNDVLRNIKEFCRAHLKDLNDEIERIHKLLDSGKNINNNYMLCELKNLEESSCQYRKIVKDKDEEEITNTEWYQAHLSDAPCYCLKGIVLKVEAKSFEEAYEMMFETLMNSAYEEEFKKQLILSIEILKKDKVNVIVYSGT